MLFSLQVLVFNKQKKDYEVEKRFFEVNRKIFSVKIFGTRGKKMLHRIVGFLGTISAILFMSLIGLLSLVAPSTADTITERLMEWAETDDN